jgi:hypothetical protein
MGYVEIIKDGMATRIEDDRVTTSYVGNFIWCDNCETHQPEASGLEILMVDTGSVMWLCAKCRR